MANHTIPVVLSEKEYQHLVAYLVELHPEKPTREQVIEAVRGMVVDHVDDVTDRVPA